MSSATPTEVEKHLEKRLGKGPKNPKVSDVPRPAKPHASPPQRTNKRDRCRRPYL
jgi:hypothetical protein